MTAIPVVFPAGSTVTLHGVCEDCQLSTTVALSGVSAIPEGPLRHLGASTSTPKRCLGCDSPLLLVVVGYSAAGFSVVEDVDDEANIAVAEDGEVDG